MTFTINGTHTVLIGSTYWTAAGGCWGVDFVVRDGFQRETKHSMWFDSDYKATTKTPEDIRDHLKAILASKLEKGKPI